MFTSEASYGIRLLSGTPTKEKAADARGGFCVKLARSVISLKDFTSILSMHGTPGSDSGALCVKFTMALGRNLGVDGGRTLTLEREACPAGGCTPPSHHHAVTERWASASCLPAPPAQCGAGTGTSASSACHDRARSYHAAELADAVQRCLTAPQDLPTDAHGCGREF